MLCNRLGIELINSYPESHQVVTIEEAEAIVNELVVQQLRENEFSALVSFVTTVGYTGFLDSRVLKLVNEKQILHAAKYFDEYKYYDNKLSATLLKRREKEKALFRRPELVRKNLKPQEETG